MFTHIFSFAANLHTLIETLEGIIDLIWLGIELYLLIENPAALPYAGP